VVEGGVYFGKVVAVSGRHVAVCGDDCGVTVTGSNSELLTYRLLTAERDYVHALLRWRTLRQQIDSEAQLASCERVMHAAGLSHTVK
jgi:hypothetical protein